MEGGDSIDRKQTYLREEILDRHYDPGQFIEYLNARLSIGDNLEMCTFEQLRDVVQMFRKSKDQAVGVGGEEGEDRRGGGDAVQLEAESKNLPLEKESKNIAVAVSPTSQVHIKQIMFDRYNFTQPEFSKTYQCLKIGTKYGSERKIKCQVLNPQRKNTGGFFGIGGTSFLEFQVRTPELGWLVGRRYSDFVWLRAYLCKVYPTQVVPPVPEKKASKKTQRHVEKRMRVLEYFLNDLVKVPEFLNNRFVQGFLKVTDGVKLQQLKDEADKVLPFESVSTLETAEGQVSIRLTQESRAYLTEMQRFVPEAERLYKEVTRRGKQLQSLCTEQVNTLYESGNLFAELHEKSRQILNKLPKSAGLKQLNDIYITLNNMMIEWGNTVRNQHAFYEKNFNTFFKYVRNQLHGYQEIFVRQAECEEAFARGLAALERKKEKVYGMFEVGRWELPAKEQAEVSKEILHDRGEAYRRMLPRDTIELERLRLRDYVYIDRLLVNGNANMNGASAKFMDNFKEFAIKMKVNTQQLSQLWSEMGVSFSGAGQQVQKVREKPQSMARQEEEILDV